MYTDSKVAVVIPCYQVEHQVADVINQIPNFVDAVIAVDDASTDGTRRILDSLNCPRLTILYHAENQGVGGAMSTGYEYALQIGAQIVVKVDGDGQMNTDRIQELIDPLTDDICDYVKGNRFLHTLELADMPFLRKLGNIALTFLTKLCSGYWHVFDPQNGFVAIHQEFLSALDLNRLRKTRYFFENEMLIQLNIMAARVMDRPIPSVYGNEASSLRILEILRYYPFGLMCGFFHRTYHRYILRDFSIIVPLYLTGLSMFLFGVIFGTYNWYYFSVVIQRAAPAGTILVAVLPLILGFQMLIQGLLIDILQSPKADSVLKRR